MEFLSQIERTILGWLKSIPHLPKQFQQWLGDNAWWMAAGGAALTGLVALGMLVAVLGDIAALTSPVASWFVSTTVIIWSIVKTLFIFVSTALVCAIFAYAVIPVKEKQKKGWVLLFGAFLVTAVSAFLMAVLTLNFLGFISSILFSALILAIWAYFLFEIHGEFAHDRPVKDTSAKK